MAAAKRLVVELYYDVVSPYSYFCFEALTRYRQPWDMDLRLKPFHLGGVMKAANNKPPAMVCELKEFEGIQIAKYKFQNSENLGDRLPRSVRSVASFSLHRCPTERGTWSRI